MDPWVRGWSCDHFVEFEATGRLAAEDHQDSVILSIDGELGVCGQPITASSLGTGFRYANAPEGADRWRQLGIKHESCLPEETGESPLSNGVKLEIYQQRHLLTPLQ